MIRKQVYVCETYDYILRFAPTIQKDILPDRLIGRRIDYKYEITPQGEFAQKKLE